MEGGPQAREDLLHRGFHVKLCRPTGKVSMVSTAALGGTHPSQPGNVNQRYHYSGTSVLFFNR